MMKAKEKKEYFLPEAEFILYSKTVIIASFEEEQVDDGNYGSDASKSDMQWRGDEW